MKVKGSEIGYSLQKIENVLNLQQQLQQVKEDKSKQQQSRKANHSQQLLFHNHQLKEEAYFKEKENLLIKAIDIMLSPTPTIGLRIAAIQKDCFDYLVTSDKNLRYQQNITEYCIGFIVLIVRTTIMKQNYHLWMR